MVGINDGLGYEELGQVGSQVASVWLTGSLLVDNLISGANIYSTADIKGVSIYGTTVVSGLLVKATGISADTILGTTISGTTIVNGTGVLKSVSIGSGTAVYGAKIQAGSGVLSAGSAAWIVYPLSYLAAPAVIVTNSKTISKTLNAGSIVIGSFMVWGETASDTFSWLSVGI